MSKKLLYYLIFPALIALGIYAFTKQKKNRETFQPIKERSGALANSPEWKETRNRADSLLAQIKRNPSDGKLKIKLAEIYIQEGRVTADHLYYDRAAMQLVNSTLKTDSLNFLALCYKSMLYLSEHHFTEALVTAEKAKNLVPDNAFVYGLLTDANVELGNYTQAVAMTDKMVSTRPDLRSYSRVSYLREIYGDYPGAIEAMKLAVAAGYPGLEDTEWARICLGMLYENTGDLKNAEMQYLLALDERPSYPYAYAGLARLARGQKNYPEAINLYLKADSVVNDNAFKDELIDIYLLNGDEKKAKAIAKTVLDKLKADAKSGMDDESIGHYADRELAFVYIKTKDYDKALEHATMEYNRRPLNNDVNETFAWAYYMNGDYKNAKEKIKISLQTNSKNPVLLSHAALIYERNGDSAKAKQLLEEALKNKPNLNPLLLNELNTVFKLKA